MKHRGVFLAGFVGVFALVTGVVAQQPPTNLHQVGDHWTAWDPPASQEPGAQIHLIVPGDTLWDLAEHYYGDPYLWPQLWERNQYIRDSHWIYPGDPLVVGFEVTPLETLADMQDQVEETGQRGDGFDRSTEPPTALGFEADLYCSGYIASLDRAFPHRVIGSEYQNIGPTLTQARNARRAGSTLEAPTGKVLLSVGDIIYVDGGAQAGMLPGTLYTSVEPREIVTHPTTGDQVGRFYQYRGQIRILSVQETTAIAEVSASCGPLGVGSWLEPFQVQPVPLRRRTPLRGVNDPVALAQLEGAPMIIYSQDDVVSLGTNNVVYLDRGEAELTPGDLFTIYRRGASGVPPMVLGELAVLAVNERSSVARIIEARYTILIGDALDPK